MTMERAEWLEQMRKKAEDLYDHYSPQYWVTFGLAPNETHLAYLQKFLEQMPPNSRLLSAGCGAGRYDGILLEAGHRVVGIDQSAGMLKRARERFPHVQYQKMGFQEMEFHEVFDGVICIDAMEHSSPEDWPEIMRRFQRALKPDRVLYLTVDLAEGDDVKGAYERARALGLPVVFGEVADQVDEAYVQVTTSDKILWDRVDVAVYHYHPSLEQVRAWIGEASMNIEDEGTGNGYEHILARKK
jgi:cyclopropane fatty-acyl-phospholipid synthase-like methyltransferase